VAHREVAPDRVGVAAPEPGAVDVAGLDEVGKDPLRRTLRDPDPFGDVTQPHVRVLGEAEQHLGVIGHEGPGPRALAA